MIYDSNDLSILFLPDKKINYWQYRDLIAQKRRAINRDGRYLTNSPKRRQKVDEIENLSWLMFVLIYFVSLPANIIAVAMIKSVVIYLLLIPLLLVIPIACCICTGMNSAKKSKLKKCNAVCIGYLHREQKGFRGVRMVSSPLYRIETANGPLFVHCELGNVYSKFPDIGQMVSLYISDEGPNECYADNQKALLIVSLICLGVNILFIFIMILVKIM